MLRPESASLPARQARRTGIVTGLILGLALTFLGAAATRAAAPKAGDPFPDLGKFEFEGTVPDLKGKVVLVDFWASWCGPCKKSFPVMAELQEKFAGRGFAVVAVSVDEKKGAMDGFVKKAQPPFAVVRDGQGKLAEAAGVDKMPTSFLLGPDGRIVSVHSGFEGEATRKKYLDEIEAALKAAGK